MLTIEQLRTVGDHSLRLVGLGLVIALAFFVWSRTAMAAWGFIAVYLVRLGFVFPQLDDRHVLGTFVCLIAALGMGGRPYARCLAVVTLRSALVVALLWMGAQKLLHGTWWSGQWLVTSASRPGWIATLADKILPAADQARIASARLMGVESVTANLSWPVRSIGMAVGLAQLAAPAAGLRQGGAAILAAAVIAGLADALLLMADFTLAGLFVLLAGSFTSARVEKGLAVSAVALSVAVAVAPWVIAMVRA